MPIKSLDFAEAMILLDRENVEFATEKLSKGWITLLIYKDEVILKVIKDIPKIPKTIAEHYLLGVLCGYSNESICEFIKKEFNK